MMTAEEEAETGTIGIETVAARGTGTETTGIGIGRGPARGTEIGEIEEEEQRIKAKMGIKAERDTSHMIRQKIGDAIPGVTMMKRCRKNMIASVCNEMVVGGEGEGEKGNLLTHKTSTTRLG